MADDALRTDPTSRVFTLPRDVRIDFIRGVALFVILIDHTKGNFLGTVTPMNFGFSDMAEVFVFLSGIVSGHAYQRILMDDGFLACQVKSLRRCLQLYAAIVCTMLAMCVTILALRYSIPDYFVIVQTRLLQQLSHDSYDVLVGFFALRQVAHVLVILIMYMIFLALLPVLLLGFNHVPRTTLLLSGLCYCLAQFGGPRFAVDQLLSQVFDAKWDFNPLAWQLLFFLGVFLGSHRSPSKERGAGPFSRLTGIDSASPNANPGLCCGKLSPSPACERLRLGVSWREIIVRVARQRTVVILSFMAVYFSMCWKLCLYEEQGEWFSKPNLGIVRLLHFGFLLIAGLQIIGPGIGLGKSLLARPFIVCGRNPLIVFCCGAVLSKVSSCVIWSMNDSRLGQILVTIAAGGMCVVTALAWERLNAMSRRSPEYARSKRMRGLAS